MDAVTLALIKSMAGNGSGSLPPVTSQDNGKVLGVVDGEWTASEQGKKFIVTLTPTALDYSGTMDKTVAEINAAYEAGMEIWFRFYESDSSYYDAQLAYTNSYSGSQYYAFYIIDAWNNIIIQAWTTSTPSGNDYYAKVYTLTPAS